MSGRGEAQANVERSNWSGNYRYTAASLEEPRTTEQLQELVATAHHVRALGTRHSFNDLADIRGGTQISLRQLSEVEMDEAAGTVKVGAGITYAALAPTLEARGRALHNLASLPHISVAGATATATHGSGLANGNLSTAVVALELVGADGKLRRYSAEKDPEPWGGLVVALGSLGVVRSLTLQTEPAYAVRQTVYEHLPFGTLCEHLPEICASGYSVSVFTDWESGEAAQVWVKRRVEGEDEETIPDALFGAKAAAGERHPLPQHDTANCTPQMGVPGPWYERLPHFRSEFTPSSGDELQTEYLLPFDRGAEAIVAVAPFGARIAPLLLISELRTIAADRFWLSPSAEQQSLALHFTWKPQWAAVQKLLPEIEGALAPFGARPHWAKLFTMDPSYVRSLYPERARFAALADRLDPERKFRNPFVDRYIFA